MFTAGSETVEAEQTPPIESLSSFNCCVASDDHIKWQSSVLLTMTWHGRWFFIILDNNNNKILKNSMISDVISGMIFVF